MNKPLDINKDNFEAEVLKSDLPVLVDFWAPWCMPCKMMAPVLEELATLMDGKIKVMKVNTEDSANQELALRYEIQSVPSMMLFKDGQLIWEFIGMHSRDSLAQEIEEHLKK